MEKRKQSLDALQERVGELKEHAKLEEIPLQMQVMISKCVNKSDIVAGSVGSVSTKGRWECKWGMVVCL